MLTQTQKAELQNEFSLLVSANMKKDGTPKKKTDPIALRRIAEIRELADIQNRKEQTERRLAEIEKVMSFLLSFGLHIGDKVKFQRPLQNGEEYGVITSFALLPCPPQVGQIGVSVDGSAPYMFRPEELTIA